MSVGAGAAGRVSRSGAIAVQVRGSREIEHLGSTHSEAECEALKVAAQQRLATGQLGLGLR
jgi:hypothetical protein